MNVLPTRISFRNLAVGSNGRTVGSLVCVCITRHLPRGPAEPSSETSRHPANPDNRTPGSTPRGGGPCAEGSKDGLSPEVFACRRR